MPSDAKKKRDAKKKEASKKRDQKKGTKDEVNGEGEEVDAVENGRVEMNGETGVLHHQIFHIRGQSL